ncbi:UNVERIFIED_ORG: ComEC/Rec2 family competence protein [Bacillus sp. AZ43]
MTRSPEPRWSWLDLRLAPAALTLWVTTICAPWVAPEGLAGAAGLACAGAVPLLRRRGPVAALALTVLAGVSVAGASGAVRGWDRDGSPLRAVAADERVVTVDLELDADPHVIGGPGGPRVVVDATVRRLDGPEKSYGLRDPVLLFGSTGDWRELLPGQRARVRVAVGLPERGDGAVAVLSARGPPDLLGGPGRVQGAAGDLREALADSARRVLEPRPAGLLPGLVVGDTSAMDPVLEEDFRRAGLAHLTAVSGANVAIVLAGVLLPLRRWAVDRRVQAAVAGLALVGFVVLARPEPSVLRAAAMGAVTLVALASGRSRAAIPSLCAAVCVLLLLDPGLAVDPGFALSVAATGGIVLLAPGWSRVLRDRGCWALLADAVAVSAAAGVVTAPLVAGLSGTVSLVSLPANLLAAPAVPAATVLGLLAAVVGVPLPVAADVLVWLAGWPTRWLVVVAARAADVPDGAVGWVAGTGGAVLLTVLLLAVGWALWRFRRLRPLALAVLLGLVVLGWPARQAVRGWPPDDAVAIACDVGQGDAFLLPTGPGAGVLVDAGPDVGAVDRCLDRLGVDTLPLVLVSHLDADHVGGLAGALSGRSVGEVATGTLSPADDRAGAFDALVRRAGGQRAVLVPGDRRAVGGVAVEVLAPEPGRAVAAAEPNDLSLVVRITTNGLRILFTGDLGAEAQARLVAEGTDLRADVLKVPHHGSGDADADFLAAGGARVALISVGAGNTYGHPAGRLLSWLTGAGMRVHRTDTDGDLAVVGSGEGWGVAARGSGDRALAVASDRRPRVTPCRGAGPTRGTHLPAARRDGRGGAAALPRGRRRPQRRARPPPRHRGLRARRRRAAARPAGRRPGALAVRRAPARGGHRRAGVRRRPGRLARELREGPRPRPDAGHRPLRRQAQRGPGQGLHRRGGGARRVPQAQVARRPGRLRPQRGPAARRPHRARRRRRAGRRHRQRPAAAVGRGQPAGLRLRRQHRRRRRRAVPPGPGRGHRLHRGRAGARRRPRRLHRDAALGPRTRGRPRAHRRRDRRRRPYRRPRRLAQLHQPRRTGPHAEDAAVEGQEGPGPVTGLEHRRAAAGDRRGRRAQCRRQGRRGQRRLRARAGGPADRHHPGRDRPGQPGPRRLLTRARNSDEPPSRRDRGSFGPRRSAGRRLRGRRPAWPDPTCGSRPGSCG